MDLGQDTVLTNPVVIVNSVKPTLPAIYKGRIGNQKGYKSLQINYVT